MTARARSATLSEHGTQVGTQRNITSHSGTVLRTVRGGVPDPDVLRKRRGLRIEPDRTFIGSMCVCGQHPRVWTIYQLFTAWGAGR